MDSAIGGGGSVLARRRVFALDGGTRRVCALSAPKSSEARAQPLHFLSAMSRLVLTPFPASTSIGCDVRGVAAVQGDERNTAAIVLRLTVVREIASSLPTLSVSGQQFAMRKILALFTDDVRHHVVTAFGLDSALASNAVEQLRHETTRIVPDAEMFSRTVETLMARL